MKDCAGDKIEFEPFRRVNGEVDQVYIVCSDSSNGSLVLDRHKLKKLYKKAMAILDGSTGDNTRINTVKQEN